jgi:hypothetical protein
MGNVLCHKNFSASRDDIEHIESIQFAIRNLETQRIMKLKKIEEENCCEICFKNPKNLAFVSCGHVVCNECGFLSTINECPFCRKVIEYKLRLYM